MIKRTAITLALATHVAMARSYRSFCGLAQVAYPPLWENRPHPIAAGIT
jgi:hypothetical protein